MKHIFWGYIDDQQKIHLKKYTNDRQIENYERMPFVKGIFEPFYAESSEQAMTKILQRFRKEIH